MSLPMHVVLTFVILALSPITCCTTQAGPVFKTKLGSVLGSILISDEGAEFYAFRGIPYANPPTKTLRFSPPQPYDKEYEGVLDATEDGHKCIQYNHFAKTFSGDEDCLYLNVFTPKTVSQNVTDLLPVMFWIHGGGFFIGSGSLAESGPYRLIDRNVVLVSINYRLGPFGFLSTLDAASPGNYGLLDQVLALRWVRENIADFGGDPNKVTIFGVSAGSISVGFHLLSPLSKGLFNAAIAQSGSALVENSIAQDESKSLHFTKGIAKHLNCPTDSNQKMVRCLRKKPALDVIIKSALIADNYTDTSGDLITFKPVVDSAHGANAFLPDFPQKLMASKKFNAVPVIAGVNKDEGIILLSSTRGYGGIGAFGKEHIPLLLKHITPSLFSNEEQAMNCTQLLAAEYFGNIGGLNVTQKVVALNKFLGDVFITYKVDALNDLLVENNVPIYAYKLVHNGEHSFADFLPLKNILPEDGQVVAHGDEVQYLFHSTFFKSPVLSRVEDKHVSDIMLTLWTNFAKTGVPTMTGSVYDHPKFSWEPTTMEHPQYLELKANPHMVKGRLSNKYNVWNGIYKITNDCKDEL